MNLVSRVQGIILKPKEEWVKIKDEPTTIQQLFTSYAVILAAIPVVARFIGLALTGFRIPYLGGSWMGRAVLSLIFSYVFNLAVVYAFGFIINALAPTFSSTPNPPNAMKLAVYSMTPVWVAGVLHIIPYHRAINWLVTLVVLAGALYGIYVLYLGFITPLMGTPKEKTAGYLIISALVVIVLSAIVGIVLGAIFAVRGLIGLF